MKKSYQLRESDEAEFCRLLAIVNSEIFEFDGLIVPGNPSTIIKEYLQERPSKPFRVWLIDKNKALYFH